MTTYDSKICGLVEDFYKNKRWGQCIDAVIDHNLDNIDIDEWQGVLLYWRIGQSYKELKNYVKAKQIFEKMIMRYPNRHQSYEGLVNIAQHQKDYEKVVNYALYFQEKFPQLWQSYWWIGHAYKDLKNYDKAEQSFRKLIDILPHDHRGYEGLVNIAQHQKDYEKVVNYALYFQEKFPQLWQSYWWIGHAYKDLKNYDKAEQSFRKLIDILPHDHRGYEGLVNIAQHQKDYEKVVNYALYFQEKFPQLWQSYWWIGHAYKDLKNYDKAEQSFRKLIDILPHDHRGYEGLVNIAQHQKDYEKVVDLTNQTINIFTYHAPFYYHQGIALLQLEDFERAEQQLFILKHKFPNDILPYLGLSDLYISLEKWDLYFNILKEAILNVSNKDFFTRRLIKSYVKFNSLDMALETHEKFLKNISVDDEVVLGEIYKLKYGWDYYIQFMEKVAVRYSDCPIAQMYYATALVGYSIFESADYIMYQKKGMELLERLYAQYPKHDQIIASLIKTNIILKKYDDAVSLYRVHQPKNFEITKFINWYFCLSEIDKKNILLLNSTVENYHISFCVIDQECLLFREKIFDFCKSYINDYFERKLTKFKIKPKLSFGHQNIIWQYWGQGFLDENLSDIVKICLCSVSRNKGEYIVIRLDDTNIMEYIDIPDFILQKRINPQFGYERFSELLSLMLLNAYGGIWMDVSTLLTKNIPPRILDKDFFVFQGNPNIMINSIEMQSDYFEVEKKHYTNIINDFIIGTKNNIVIEICMNLLLNYWRHYHSFPHKKFFQILFSALTAELKDIETYGDINDNTNPNPFTLQLTIRKQFSEEKYNQIKENSFIHFLPKNINKVFNHSYYQWVKDTHSNDLHDKYYLESDNEKISIVTAFFDIGRDSWGDKNSRSTDKYFSYFANLAKLENEMIVFVAQENIEKVRQLRDGRKTVIVPFDFHNNFCGYRERIFNIQQMDDFKSKINPFQNHNPEYQSADYVLINNLKSFFVHYAITKGLLMGSALIAWVDFGCCRTEKIISRTRILNSNRYIWQYNFNKDKFHIFSINHMYKSIISNDDVEKCIYNNKSSIVGGYLVANRDKWQEFFKMMSGYQQEFLDQNIIDDDQSLLLKCYQNHKDFFQVNFLGFNKWFSIFDKYSNHYV